MSSFPTEPCKIKISNIKNPSNGSLPGFVGLEPFREKIAITHQDKDYLYEDLYMGSWELAKGILGMLDSDQMNQKICILCDTGLSHIITTWACWMTGNTAVPLPVGESKQKLELLIRDSGASILISTKSQAEFVDGVAKSIGLKHVALDDSWWNSVLDDQDDKDDKPLPNHFVDNSVYKCGSAMVLYSGGRGGKPRGFVISHDTLNAQMDLVINSWDITGDDSILHSLNLHQMYSLVCSLYSPLQQRARIITVPPTQTEKIWSHLLAVNKPPITVFPGTPWMYNNLLKKAGDIFKNKKTKEYVKSSCTKKIRLMTSGGTSLPEQLHSQWRNLTGHKILNNYVSTASGTIFSNRVAGPSNLQGPGCFDCGAPLEGVQVRLVRFRDHTKTTFDVILEDDSSGPKVIEEGEGGVLGELLVKGDNMTKRVIESSEEKDLTSFDGWSAIGDIVQYKAGCYSLKGKLNVKCLEIGGEMVSLVEVQKKLLSSVDIVDAFVVGLGDFKDDTRLAAVLVLNKNVKFSAATILEWCTENMEPNSVPSVLKIVEGIPRDGSGHVNKMKIFSLFPNTLVLGFSDTKL